MTGSRKKIVVDAREFAPRRFTGIGRVLFGLAGALAEMPFVDKIILAASSYEAVPVKLKSMKQIAIKKVPGPFLASERYLTHLTKGGACLFLSPYPKLPLFRCHCPTIHTIHDVLYLTHPAYKKRFRASFDLLRLKMALRKADITWYDSS
ncbi:MAG: hypothetical protein SWE60_21785, partial [Thermodesulfobacteriota bacterium]|nr:hypothetical protein [Thermodesulfobacteriota bacterium]